MQNIKDLMIDPIYHNQQIKQFNKGKYKREQPIRIQNQKILLAKLKRERKLLNKNKSSKPSQ